MRQVRVVADAIISPLGNSSEETFMNLLQGKSGIRLLSQSGFSDAPIMAGHLPELVAESNESRFELLVEKAIQALKMECDIPTTKTVFILSTTKGNIEWLERNHVQHPMLSIPATAEKINRTIGAEGVLTVSNACTSGVVAIITAKRLLDAGLYDHAVVVGADVLSKFVVSGFQCLQAMSPEICRPFDAHRKGINLGEAAGVLLLSTTLMPPNYKHEIVVGGGAITNDANHISGPSKTGEELALAVSKSLQSAKISSTEVDFISAHGTATLYNDEMEAKAFHLADLLDKPLNSLKGYFGHTLGAAGVLEAIITCQSMSKSKLVPSLGFEKSGVSKALNLVTQVKDTPLQHCLKTASGFGGCNASLVLSLT